MTSSLPLTPLLHEPYLGFEFDKVHTSNFNLCVVSDGSRYYTPFYNSFSDSIVSVAGKSAGFWFGTQIGNREFSVHLAFENLLNKDIAAIQRWLYPDKAGYLIFNETPYKRYYAKISVPPSFSFVPFDGLIKGEFDVSFLLLTEYGEANPDWNFDENTVEESGILPINYKHNKILMPNEPNSVDVGISEPINIYNAGNGISDAEFHFVCEPFPASDSLKIFNAESGEISIIQSLAKLLPDSAVHWKIALITAQKECWGWGLDGSGNQINSKPIHIGAAFNHFYPRIYGIKPLQSRGIGQVVHMGQPDLLFYSCPLSDFENFQPSNKPKENLQIQGFDESLSDTFLCTPQGTFFVDSVLSPFHLQIKEETGLFATIVPPNTKGYFIRPNQFFFNKPIKNFSVRYNHSYI